jgi:hypothetical protein
MRDVSVPSFYAGLPAITRFRGIADARMYAPLPGDWSLALTDVAGSTQAIVEGRYREVNRAGAIAIMALSNMFRDLDLPFVFGGDGVVFALPPDRVDDAKDVLADTRRLVKDAFGLALRVAFVPVADLVARGHTISVARFTVSPLCTQALFAGDGIEAADRLAKEEGSAYLLPASHPQKGIADFSGFNCRWKDVASPRGETLSLIVRPRDADGSVLDRLLDEVARVAGGEGAYHPLSVNNLHSAVGESAAVESRLAGHGWLARLKLALTLRIGSHLIEKGIRGKVEVNGYDLADVKQSIIANCDYRKFDGTLKMVLAASRGERRKIESWLERARDAGELAFGLHVSDRAVLTCLVNEGTTREIHFVDAADGGYALAAKALKEAALRSP